MKKIVLAVIVIVFSLIAKAQNVAIGIKVGSNITKITGKAFKEEFQLGYNAGAFAELAINKDFGIQPEVLYNQVNTKRASGFDSVFNGWQQNTSNIKLNYLTIPILFRYNVNKLISINLGPQYGILLNNNESLWTNGKEAIKRGEFSMIGGLTIKIKSIRAFGRYIIGLSNINDLQNSDSWKSQQIQLGVGFKF